MGTKNNPGAFDCYANAEPDEPMFILLGRDPHAAAAVLKWADDRETMIECGQKPDSDRAMVIEARECARAMVAYSDARERRLSLRLIYRMEWENMRNGTTIGGWPIPYDELSPLWQCSRA